MRRALVSSDVLLGTARHLQHITTASSAKFEGLEACGALDLLLDLASSSSSSPPTTSSSTTAPSSSAAGAGGGSGVVATSSRTHTMGDATQMFRPKAPSKKAADSDASSKRGGGGTFSPLSSLSPPASPSRAMVTASSSRVGSVGGGTLSFPTTNGARTAEVTVDDFIYDPTPKEVAATDEDDNDDGDDNDGNTKNGDQSPDARSADGSSSPSEKKTKRKASSSVSKKKDKTRSSSVSKKKSGARSGEGSAVAAADTDERLTGTPSDINSPQGNADNNNTNQNRNNGTFGAAESSIANASPYLSYGAGFHTGTPSSSGGQQHYKPLLHRASMSTTTAALLSGGVGGNNKAPRRQSSPLAATAAGNATNDTNAHHHMHTAANGALVALGGEGGGGFGGGGALASPTSASASFTTTLHGVYDRHYAEQRALEALKRQRAAQFEEDRRQAVALVTQMVSELTDAVSHCDAVFVDWMQKLVTVVTNAESEGAGDEIFVKGVGETTKTTKTAAAPWDAVSAMGGRTGHFHHATNTATSRGQQQGGGVLVVAAAAGRGASSSSSPQSSSSTTQVTPIACFETILALLPSLLSLLTICHSLPLTCVRVCETAILTFLYRIVVSLAEFPEEVDVGQHTAADDVEFSTSPSPSSSSPSRLNFKTLFSRLLAPHLPFLINAATLQMKAFQRQDTVVRSSPPITLFKTAAVVDELTGVREVIPNLVFLTQFDDYFWLTAFTMAVFGGDKLSMFLASRRRDNLDDPFHTVLVQSTIACLGYAIKIGTTKIMRASGGGDGGGGGGLVDEIAKPSLPLQSVVDFAASSSPATGGSKTNGNAKTQSGAGGGANNSGSGNANTSRSLLRISMEEAAFIAHLGNTMTKIVRNILSGSSNTTGGNGGDGGGSAAYNPQQKGGVGGGGGRMSYDPLEKVHLPTVVKAFSLLSWLAMTIASVDPHSPLPKRYAGSATSPPLQGPLTLMGRAVLASASAMAACLGSTTVEVNITNSTNIHTSSPHQHHHHHHQKHHQQQQQQQQRSFFIPSEAFAQCHQQCVNGVTMLLAAWAFEIHNQKNGLAIVNSHPSSHVTAGGGGGGGGNVMNGRLTRAEAEFEGKHKAVLARLYIKLLSNTIAATPPPPASMMTMVGGFEGDHHHQLLLQQQHALFQATASENERQRLATRSFLRAISEVHFMTRINCMKLTNANPIDRLLLPSSAATAATTNSNSNNAAAAKSTVFALIRGALEEILTDCNTSVAMQNARYHQQVAAQQQQQRRASTGVGVSRRASLGGAHHYLSSGSGALPFSSSPSPPRNTNPIIMNGIGTAAAPSPLSSATASTIGNPLTELWHVNLWKECLRIASLHEMVVTVGGGGRNLPTALNPASPSFSQSSPHSHSPSLSSFEAYWALSTTALRMLDDCSDGTLLGGGGGGGGGSSSSSSSSSSLLGDLRRVTASVYNPIAASNRMGMGGVSNARNTFSSVREAMGGGVISDSSEGGGGGTFSSASNGWSDYTSWALIQQQQERGGLHSASASAPLSTPRSLMDRLRLVSASETQHPTNQQRGGTNKNTTPMMSSATSGTLSSPPQTHPLKLTAELSASFKYLNHCVERSIVDFNSHLTPSAQRTRIIYGGGGVGVKPHAANESDSDDADDTHANVNGSSGGGNTRSQQQSMTNHIYTHRVANGFELAAEYLASYASLIAKTAALPPSVYAAYFFESAMLMYKEALAKAKTDFIEAEEEMQRAAPDARTRQRTVAFYQNAITSITKKYVEIELILANLVNYGSGTASASNNIGDALPFTASSSSSYSPNSFSKGGGGLLRQLYPTFTSTAKTLGGLFGESGDAQKESEEEDDYVVISKEGGGGVTSKSVNKNTFAPSLYDLGLGGSRFFDVTTASSKAAPSASPSSTAATTASRTSHSHNAHPSLTAAMMPSEGGEGALVKRVTSSVPSSQQQQGVPSPALPTTTLTADFAARVGTEPAGGDASNGLAEERRAYYADQLHLLNTSEIVRTTNADWGF